MISNQSNEFSEFLLKLNDLQSDERARQLQAFKWISSSLSKVRFVFQTKKLYYQNYIHSLLTLFFIFQA